MAEKLSKKVRAYLSALGKKGGPARASRLTKARRQEIARRAAKARWAKRTRQP